jgi:hypothetical protein
MSEFDWEKAVQEVNIVHELVALQYHSLLDDLPSDCGQSMAQEEDRAGLHWVDRRCSVEPLPSSDRANH